MAEIMSVFNEGTTAHGHPLLSFHTEISPFWHSFEWYMILMILCSVDDEIFKVMKLLHNVFIQFSISFYSLVRLCPSLLPLRHSFFRTSHITDLLRVSLPNDAVFWLLSQLFEIRCCHQIQNVTSCSSKWSTYSVQTFLYVFHGPLQIFIYTLQTVPTFSESV